MKRALSEEIVANIRNSLPANENIISFLSELFKWSKESIYRRLRFEIAFTLEELVVIASKLNFSIDHIVRLNQTECVLFDLDLSEVADPTDLYCEKREQLTTLAREISTAAGSESMFAINNIPFSFIAFFETLTKFDYYKWMHQSHNLNPDISLADITLPNRIEEMHKTWIAQNRKSSTVTFILDNNVFLSIIRDIDYFYKRRLINTEEIELFRNELLELVKSLLLLAQTGIAATGEKVQLYLSPTDIATNHSYLEYNDSACSYIQIYGIDILQSYYPEACRAHKSWIERYKRFSTLITQCNEKERFDYFDRQNSYIMNLGKVNF